MMTRQLQNGAATILLLSLALVSEVHAQGNQLSPDAAPVPAEQAVTPAPSEAQPKLLTNYVEAGGNYLILTNGFGHWAGGYARGVYESKNDVWNGELNGQHEFGDSGVYMAVGDTHTFTPDWYGALTIGSSVGGFFWPRFRTDAFVNRKLLSRKQWITTAGFTYYAAKDVHRDYIVNLGSTYYFDKPWILEEGLYLNISNPGTVFAPAGFVAVTQGHNKHQYVTVRAGIGEEGYQLVGPTVSLTQFNSESLTITWRKWLGPNWGINFVGDYYHSPFYTRGGTTLGFFRDF